MSEKNGKKSDIIDVARAAKVSPSTVSRSFNHPNLVKAATRKKIERAVRKLGYIRNRAAQTIHGIRSGTIGLVVPTIDHTIFGELIQSFSQGVDKFGFTILLASHGYNLEREYELIRKMLEHRVDGIALIGLDHLDDTYELLGQQNIPAVLLWNYAQQSELPCVGSDNYQSGYLIGEHVAKLGHRAIAGVFPPLQGNDRASHRFRGVMDALALYDIDLPETRLLRTPYSVGAAKAAIREMLSEHDRPTAIICGNDVLAWGALHALKQLGLDAPDDISVVGIGDFAGSADFEPSLTTVRIPAGAIGLKAAETIACMIKDNQTSPKSDLIQPQLQVRKSCGFPNVVQKR